MLFAYAGEIGPSVIIGHVDSAKDGPSVFFELGALKPGQRIDVNRAGGAALRLITCGVSFVFVEPVA